MEFFFTIIKLAGVLLFLVLLLSIVALFFRRFRIIGAWMLGIFVVVFLIGYV